MIPSIIGRRRYFSWHSAPEVVPMQRVGDLSCGSRKRPPGRCPGVLRGVRTGVFTAFLRWRSVRGNQKVLPPLALNHALDCALSRNTTCLLYTSDAADEEDSVDLGGRR